MTIYVHSDQIHKRHLSKLRAGTHIVTAKSCSVHGSILLDRMLKSQRQETVEMSEELQCHQFYGSAQ
jgi:hypothetical protein